MRETSRSGYGPTLSKQSGAAASLLRALAVTGAAVALRMATRPPPYRFRDRVIVLTGGSRGLGLALARQLAAEGGRLHLLARSGADVTRAVADLVDRGGFATGFPCDVRRPDEVREAIARVGAAEGRIDVLINNAGIIHSLPFDHATTGDFADALDTHFWAPLWLIRACLPWMRRQGDGRIVNIASIGGRIGVPHMAPYCASKFALVGLSETLRAELAHEHIHVTTVCPGLIRTGSYRNVLVRGRHRQEAAWFAIASALPLTTISASRAAAAILRACRRGHARAVPGWPARLADVTAAIAPGVLAAALGVIARSLPQSSTAENAQTLQRSHRLDLGWLEPLLPRGAANDLNQPEPVIGSTPTVVSATAGGMG